MTMTNAEWMLKNGYKFKDVLIYKDSSDGESGNYGIKIFKTNVDEHFKGATRTDTLLRWLDEEHDKSILDDAERRYLSAVIRPFRKNVIYIRKYSGTYLGVNYECIEVCVEGDFVKESPFSFSLPTFNAGTMYKGMKTYKEYTPEELGL